MRIVVHGGAPLQGRFQASGNSNAALALIAASLLTEQTVTLRRTPQTLSTNQMLTIAQALGAQVDRPAPNILQLQTPSLFTRSLEQALTEQQVSSVLFLGPLLARRRHARMEINFAVSRLHTHLSALKDLGISVQVRGAVLDFQAEPWKQREVLLLQPSVTATALACMLAAALGEQTTIHNAASEPHLQDLMHLLVVMGARIEGIGSNRLVIYGREQLSGADVTLSPDHIEAASFAALGAVTGGSLTIENVVPAHMQGIMRAYSRLGIQLYLNGSDLVLPAHDTLVISEREEELDVPIETAPWPGFPSDLVAMTVLIASQARGTTLIHEKLFDNRLLFVDKLSAMGAQIVLCDPHRVLVVGPSPLRGDYLDTPDVRTGLALLGAALCAQDTITIDNAELLDRTFENVVPKLLALGAQIEVKEA